VSTFDAEVVVIGTGTVGGFVARELVRAGIDVIAIDKDAPAHENSSHGGQTRMFRTAYREGAQYVPLLRRARALWLRLQDELGVTLFVPSGALLVGHRDADSTAETLRSAHAHDLPARQLDIDEARNRWPFITIRDDDVAVLDEAAGVLCADAAVTLVAADAKARGACLRTGVTATRVDDDGLGVSVTLDDHTSIRARTAVVSAGTGTAALLPALHPWVRTECLLLTWWIPSRQTHRFDASRFPMVLRSGHDAYCAWPTDDHATVKIARSGSYLTIREGQPMPDAVPHEWITLARDVIHRNVADLAPNPVRANAYGEVFSRDHRFVLGRYPPSPNIVVATGFSGHGFKFAPVIGAVVAGIVTNDPAADGVFPRGGLREVLTT